MKLLAPFSRECAVLVALLSFIVMMLPAMTVNAQEQPTGESAIAAYQKNRKAFIEEQRAASQSHKAQQDAKQQEIETLKKAITNQQDELASIRDDISGNRETIQQLVGVRSAAACALFPLFALWSMAGSMLYEQFEMALLIGFICLTIINVFLYLLFKEKAFFNRYRIILIVAIIILIGSIASPLLADDQARREEVMNKLVSAERMLSRSDYERFIAILEEKPGRIISLPVLQSGDPLFKVYEKVQIDTPEYWFTLAALYTHEGQNGKALEAVKKITQEGGLQPTPEHQAIVTNCIKYLIQAGQTQIAGAVVESLSRTMMDVSTLLQMAELLKQNGMQASAEKTLGFAIVKAENVVDLVNLSTYFFDHGEPDKGNEALDKAVNRIRNIDDIRLIVERAITLDKDVLIDSIVKKMDRVANDYREQLVIVDLFLQHQRKEEAVNLISRLIRGGMSRSQANIDRLLYLIDAALQRNLLPQATEATETLIFLLGIDRAKDTTMGSTYPLKSYSGLPDEDKVKLTQFYGLINEEQGFNDIAEDAYIQSVLESLSTIIASYGYTFPESMNDFYLLGRIWLKGNRNDLIAQLDRVYTVIERQFVKKQEAVNSEKLQALQEEIDRLKEQSTEALQSIAETRQQQRDLQRKLAAQWLSAIGTIIFILAALGGCAIIAARYCRQLSMGRTFGFFVKFAEAHGWLQVLSVLGAISGFISIVCAQFFLIFQNVQENTYRLATSSDPAHKRTAVPVPPAPDDATVSLTVPPGRQP